MHNERKRPLPRPFLSFDGYLLIIRPLEARGLDVLEVRGAGREAVHVEEGRVEDPVAVGRIVDLVAALERAVVVVRVEEVDQRSAVA